MSQPRAIPGRMRREFASFYVDSYPAVARALSVTLGDPDLGTEAADEAMARCYSHWSKVQQYENPAGWVFRVGLNWARSLRRRLARRPTGHRSEAEVEPTVADPEIHRAVMDLDVSLRGVVVCRFLLDWSVKQTAEALDIRPGTVKSRTARALESLENKLYHYKNEG